MLRAPSARPRPPSVTACAVSPSASAARIIALRPCPPEANVLAAWSLRKLDPHASARYVVAAPKGKPAHCTCPDHERSGWTCKHLGALLALGLLPAPKPATAKAKRLHAKNARLAIAEAKAPAGRGSPAPGGDRSAGPRPVPAGGLAARR